MIKFFEDFNKNDEYIKYLIYMSFDIDDNLIYAPTKIKMLHNIDGEWVYEYVSTEKFAVIRTQSDWKFLDGEESFEEFRDWGPKGDNTFLSDFKYSVLNKKFAPSWNKFIECLVNGHIFSIVTSRGHSPENVRKAFRWLIYEYGLNKFKNLPIKNVDKTESFEDQMIQNLLKYHELFNVDVDYVIDEYLNNCPIYTVTSDEFREKFGNNPVEISKKIALRDFNNIVRKYSDILGVRAKYGFSDDDPRFVKSALDEFMELKSNNKNIDYTVFDTGSKKIKKIIL